MGAHILVVDDDADLAEMLSLVLADDGYQTSHAGTGPHALEMFKMMQPDLVLLDGMLPGLDGVRVCEQIRRVSGVPIIMLTARSETADVVRGLEAGADDYIVKPFNPTELKARVKARLRQPNPTPKSIVRVADVVVDTNRHEVSRDGKTIGLTPLEFELLALLATNPQKAFTRDELLEQVWGYHYKADTRLVNVHVQRLRAKVELDVDDPKIVVTVRGIGYRSGTITG